MKYIKKLFNICVAFICVASASAVDSPSWIPTIVFVLTFGYLAVLALRKGAFEGYEDEV